MNSPARAMIEPIRQRDNDAKTAAGLLAGLETTLNDIQHIIAAVPPAAYNACNPGQSSIGAHMRHMLEFIQVLADSVDSGEVDYESRAHNAALERDPQAVAAMLPQLHAKLTHALKRHGADHALMLRETTCAGGNKLSIATSLGREILFMVQHAVHHLAIIKMQADALTIHLGETVGVAVATQAYREQINN